MGVIAGATLRALSSRGLSVLNVNMNILDGSLQNGGIAGVRVDLPIQPPGQPATYPQVSSYFFYQAGTRVKLFLSLALDKAVSLNQIVDFMDRGPNFLLHASFKSSGHTTKAWERDK